MAPNPKRSLRIVRTEAGECTGDARRVAEDGSVWVTSYDRRRVTGKTYGLVRDGFVIRDVDPEEKDFYR